MNNHFDWNVECQRKLFSKRNVPFYMQNIFFDASSHASKDFHYNFASLIETFQRRMKSGLMKFVIRTNRWTYNEKKFSLNCHLRFWIPKITKIVLRCLVSNFSLKKRQKLYSQILKLKWHKSEVWCYKHDFLLFYLRRSLSIVWEKHDFVIKWQKWNSRLFKIFVNESILL